jgi:hypothetical protein
MRQVTSQKAVENFLALGIHGKLVTHQVLNAMCVSDQQGVTFANPTDVLIASQYKVCGAAVGFYRPSAGS